MVELAQRSILTGWLILIPAELSFLRLVAALLTSLAVLVWTLSARPYRRTEDSILAVVAVLLLTLGFTGALLVKTFEDFSEAVTNPELVQQVLGFSSPDGIVTILIVFTVVMIFLIAVAGVYSLRSEGRMGILLLKESRQRPMLSWHPGQVWMLFISHTWRTGQDQAASIKRQLQRMLPGIPVFLDVDECAVVAQSSIVEP